jgi:hypothetical protein
MSIPHDYEIKEYHSPPSQQEVSGVLNKIYTFAKSKSTGSAEDSWYDFKCKLYGSNENDEIRKDFAAMANSGGGYIIIGISDDLRVVGVQEPFEENRFHQVLGTRGKISRHPSWIHVEGTFQDKRVVLIKVRPSPPDSLIWVSRGNSKGIPIRRGSTTEWLTDPEYFAFLQKKAIQLPDEFALDPSNTGVFSIVNSSKMGDSFEWKLKKEIYRVLAPRVDRPSPAIYPYERIIPIPFANPMVYKLKRYSRHENWSGNIEDLRAVIAEVEKRFSETYRIANSNWSIPTGEDNEFLKFVSGVSASSLVKNLSTISQSQDEISFFWVLSSGFVFSIVTGGMFKNSAFLHIDAQMTATPNSTPFLHIEGNEVNAIPLPVQEESPFEDIGREFSKIDNELFLDEPPDALLEKEAHVKIESVLGGPRKINPRFPSHFTGNLVLATVTKNTEKSAGWAISCFDPIIAYIRTHGRFTRYDKEVVMLGYEMTWLPYRTLGETSVPILFNIDIGVNQISTLKERPQKIGS